MGLCCGMYRLLAGTTMIVAGLNGVTTATAGAAEGKFREFVLPWDAAGAEFPSAAALSQPQTPRVTVDKSGHFSADGKRVRFFGVNISAASAFPSPSTAQAVAGRLSKFGVNCVRFHHMDASWSPEASLIDYPKGGSRALSADRLGKLHAFVGALAERGIYSNINLLVSRKFSSADGLPPEVDGMGWKDQHLLGYFDDKAFALQKEYAASLLMAPNPYRSRQSLAQDPAVAIVEVINEQGIVHAWLGGSLGKLPVVFQDALRSRWNAWLKQKHANMDALRASWKVAETPLGEELLGVAAGPPSGSGWVLEKHGSSHAALGLAGVGKDTWGRVDVQATSDQGWHVQLQKGGIPLTKDRAYTVSLRVRSSEPRQIRILVQRSDEDYAGAGLDQVVKTGKEWRTVDVAFVASQTFADARLCFSDMAGQAGLVDFADVSLREGGSVGEPSGGLEWDRIPLPTVTRVGWNFLPATREDWMAFLGGLEADYHGRMREVLRKEIGCEAVLIGTIMGNGTLGSQRDYGAIDAHAYWQHPQFPGKDWDRKVWKMDNKAMVDYPAQATIGSLALQRVIGKPFTVTEYQHPSPNVYASDGPLFAAAYGAFQDWDGIWLFDYGTGPDQWGRSQISGFFDMDQNPGMMVNFLAASVAFREGHVRPAKRVVAPLFEAGKESALLAEQARAWSVSGARLLGFEPLLGLIHGTGLRTSGKGDQPVNADPAQLRSDTGELEWQTGKPGEGTVVVRTDKLHATWGFLDGKRTVMGGVFFESGKTANGWCTMALVPLGQGTRLLAVTGESHNTEMRWLDETRSSVGEQWGRAPVLSEQVGFQVGFRKGPVKVTAIGPDGRDEWSAASELKDGWHTVEVPQDKASLWYRVE